MGTLEKSEAADEAVVRHLKPMSREDIMKETVRRLSHIAGSLKLCDDPDLRALE